MLIGDLMYDSGRLIFAFDGSPTIVSTKTEAKLRTPKGPVDGSYRIECIRKVDTWVRVGLSNYLGMEFWISFSDQDMYDGYLLPRVIAVGLLDSITVEFWVDSETVQVYLPVEDEEEGEDGLDLSSATE